MVNGVLVEDEARGNVRVSVVVHMRESLVPVEVGFEGGEFYGIWTDGDLDDSDECATLEAFAEAYGDECWADVAAHRGGPTLSMRALCAEARELSR